MNSSARWQKRPDLPKQKPGKLLDAHAELLTGSTIVGSQTGFAVLGKRSSLDTVFRQVIGNQKQVIFITGSVIQREN